MTLRGPFFLQHLLGIRLCFTHVCVPGFYHCTFVSQDLANKVVQSSCPHKTSSRIFFFLGREEYLFFLSFQAQHLLSSQFHRNLSSVCSCFNFSSHFYFPFFSTFNLTSSTPILGVIAAGRLMLIRNTQKGWLEDRGWRIIVRRSGESCLRGMNGSKNRGINSWERNGRID